MSFQEVNNKNIVLQCMDSCDHNHTADHTVDTEFIKCLIKLDLVE